MRFFIFANKIIQINDKNIDKNSKKAHNNHVKKAMESLMKHHEEAIAFFVLRRRK